jgi:cobyrinic acid a,c-diamide synthase
MHWIYADGLKRTDRGYTMKSIIISSDSSGSGKTTVTLGLMGALVKSGFKIQGYKVGPDYIDTAFHEKVTGSESRNLDIFLMGEDGVRDSYMRGKGDLGIVEGAMGIYDGKGIDTAYSTYHVSRVLNLPIILAMSPKGASTTICAQINGIAEFGPASIAGVIFNSITESYYRLLKAAVEKNCALQVFGYIPKDDRISLESRHLGLVQSIEIDNLDEKLDILSELVLKNVDIEKLLRCFKEVNYKNDGFHLSSLGLKIAVACDKAFQFYYKENLELLEEAGRLVFFSPIKDKKLPDDIDFLYIGGGYPEVFAAELSQNKSMLLDIRKKLDSGLRCYAECGGLMYLMDALQGTGGEILDTVGFFHGKAFMTHRLQNFGYATIEVAEDNSILKRGMKMNCHEFHRSRIESQEDKIYEVTKQRYDGSIKRWKCGYLKKNVLASYAHIHFFTNMKFITSLLNIKHMEV